MHENKTDVNWPKYHGLIVSGLSALLLFLPLQTAIVQASLLIGLPSWVALWKEVIVIGLIIVMLGEIVENLWKTKLGGWKLINKTWLLWVVFVMTIVATIGSFQQVNILYFVAGFRYSLLWVWFWAVIATWWHLLNNQIRHSLIWQKWLFRSLLCGYVFVLIFSLVLGAFGPQKIFQNLGYGQELNLGEGLSLIQPIGHVIDADGGEAQSEFRLNSTFSSPNHLAGYLLLILPLLLGLNIYWSKCKYWVEIIFGNYLSKRLVWGFLLISNLILLFLTYARYSYLAMFLVAGVLVEVYLYQKFAPKLSGRLEWPQVLSWGKNIDLIIIFLIPIFIALVAFNLPSESLQKYLPPFILKPSSTEWHKQHSAAAIRTLTNEKHPRYIEINNFEAENEWNLRAIWLGYGLGSVDPAASALPLTDNPIVSQGIGYDDEFYFPRFIEKPLALTPENWYLGLVLQSGVIFAALFVLFLFSFVTSLKQIFKNRLALGFSNFWEIALSLVLVGIFLGAAVLDLFDNQSFALFLGPIWFAYQLLQQQLSNSKSE